MPTVELHEGDAYQIVPTLETEIHCLCTDPPYGLKHRGDYTRFTQTGGPQVNRFDPILGDDQPFDPTPWLDYPKVCLFGSQFFGDRLPRGTAVVWLKKRDNQLGKFLSDAEIGWIKGGTGCYVFRHIWNGFDRESERGKTLHVTQKPAALWVWILRDRLKLKPGMTVLDPFAGSASVGLACQQLSLGYVGVELDPTYAALARRRLGIDA